MRADRRCGIFSSPTFFEGLVNEPREIEQLLLSARTLLLIGIVIAVGNEMALMTYIKERTLELRAQQLEAATIYRAAHELFLTLQGLPADTYAVRVHALSLASSSMAEIACCSGEWAELAEAVNAMNTAAQTDMAYQRLNDAVYSYADSKYDAALVGIQNNRSLLFYAFAAAGVIGLILFLFVLRITLDPLNQLKKALETASLGGGFNFPVRGFYSKEIESLGVHLDQLLTRFRRELASRELALQEMADSVTQDSESILNSVVPAFALDSRGLITSWNESMRDITLVSVGDAKGRLFSQDFIGGLDRRKFLEQIEHVKKGSHPSALLLRLLGRGDATPLVLVTTVVFLNKKGEFGGVTCLVQLADPILKRVEDIQSRQRSNQFLSLTSNAAHQIGQPLQKIRLYIANAKNRLRMKDFDRDGLREKLDGVDAQLGKLVGIMDQLRDLGRVNAPVAGGFEVRQVLYRCSELVDSINMSLGIKMTLDLDLVEERLNGHPMSLERAVLSCLSNSRDAITVRGQSSGLIELKAGRTPEGGLEILIKDNGIGVEHESMEKLFDPFYTTYTDERHLGLGLTTARASVEEANGRIDITSDIYGACVMISYPPDALLQEAKIINLVGGKEKS